MTMLEELHSLIATLTPSEKRYFSVQASMMGDADVKQYYLLYEILAAGLHWDEQRIKDAIVLKLPDANLPSLRRNLRKLLLRSLRQYRDENDSNQQLQNDVREAEIYFDKSLRELCLDKIRKTLEKAIIAEDFEVQQQLYNMQREVLLDSWPTGVRSELERIHQRCKECSTHQVNYLAYQDLYDRAFYCFRNRGNLTSRQTAAELQEIASDALMKSPDRALSLRAGIRFHMICSLICLYDGVQNLPRVSPYISSHPKAGEHLRLANILMQQHPDLRGNTVKHRIIVNSNLINSAIREQNLSEAYNGIVSLQQIESTQSERLSPRELIELQHNIYYAVVLCCLNDSDRRERFESMVNITELEEWLNTQSVEINQARVLALRYNGGILLLMLGRARDARRFLEAIPFCSNDSAGSSASRNDIRAIGRMFLPVCAFESADYQNMEGLVRSAERNLKKAGMLTKPWRIILNFLKRLPDLIIEAQSTRSRELVSNQFTKTLHRFNSAVDDAGIEGSLGVGEFRIWLNRHAAETHTM